MTTASRAPRKLPPGRPHRRFLGVPTQAARLRRGPKPPDAVVHRVQAALERDLDDPSPGTPQRHTHAALLLAALALIAWARRGVTQALPPGPERDLAASTPVPSDGAEDWAAGVLAAIGAAATAAGALAAVEEHILREHSALVAHISAAAGVASYVWTTQEDERVRPLHVELEGTVQRWDDPPISGSNNFRGHPGEPAGCRCLPWPIVR